MKCLVVAPDFYDYGYDIKHGLESLGCTADLIVIKDSLSLSNKNRNSKLFEGIDHYDLCITVKAVMLSENELKIIRSRSSVLFLWMMDPLNKFPKVKSTLHMFDKIFVFDPQDISSSTTYLPLYITSKKLDRVEVDKQFGFVGNLYGGRDKLLYQLKKHGTISGRFEFYGGLYGFKLLKLIPILLKYPSLLSNIKFGELTRTQTFEFYNTCECIINILPIGQQGLNMRFFECLGLEKKQLLVSFSPVSISEFVVNFEKYFLEDIGVYLYEINSNSGMNDEHSIEKRLQKMICYV